MFRHDVSEIDLISFVTILRYRFCATSTGLIFHQVLILLIKFYLRSTMVVAFVMRVKLLSCFVVTRFTYFLLYLF